MGAGFAFGPYFFADSMTGSTNWMELSTDGHGWNAPCEGKCDPTEGKQFRPGFQSRLSAFIRGLTACSKTSCSPREGTRPTRFPRKSACIVGPVPSPGGFLNRLLTASTTGFK